MQNTTIKDLMVPLTEYAVVSVDATLHGAFQALELARHKYDARRYRHRAVLVYDAQDLIVGKLTILDLIKALQPDYSEHMADLSLDRFGIDDDYLAENLKTDDYWNRPLEDLCRAAGSQTVGSLMNEPTEFEYIKSTATLQEAIYRFVALSRPSLLVVEGGVVIGILRLSDVFAVISQAMQDANEG